MKTPGFPLRGFLYEWRRTMLSAPLLIVIALLVLISFGVLPSINQATQQGGQSSETQCSSVYWYSGNEYHFEFYLFNQYAHPVSGISLVLTLDQFNSSVGLVPVANATGMTGSSGYLQLEVSLPEGYYNTTIATPHTLIVTSQSSGDTDLSQGWIPSPAVQDVPKGVVIPFAGGVVSTVYQLSHYATRPYLQVFLPGPNGTVPSDYQVYWAGPFNTSRPAFTPLPMSSMHLLGSQSSLQTTFGVSNVETSGNPGPTLILQVEVFTSSGQLLVTDTNDSAEPFILYTAETGPEALSAVYGYFGSILAIFVPLMAIVAAYSAYGKDRVTGVLDATLCGPVSREGLALSRFLAVIAALVLAISLASGIIDLLIHWSLGIFLPLGVTLAVMAGVLLEGASFVAILFLVSRLSRSPSVVVGAALGLFSFYFVAWDLLVTTIVLSQSSNPSVSVATLTQLDLLNPVQLPTLVETVLEGIAYPGISAVSIALDGLGWVLVPFLLFLAHVHYRD